MSTLRLTENQFIDPEGLYQDESVLAGLKWKPGADTVSQAVWHLGDELTLTAQVSPANEHRIKWSLSLNVNNGATLAQVERTLGTGAVTEKVVKAMITDVVALAEKELATWQSALAKAAAAIKSNAS